MNKEAFVIVRMSNNKIILDFCPTIYLSLDYAMVKRDRLNDTLKYTKQEGWWYVLTFGLDRD